MAYSTHKGKRPKKIIPPKCHINATKYVSPKEASLYCTKKINTKFKSMGG
jgi:hypothetical protein